MEIRAGLKECELKAHEQNCSSVEKIKYHCVMNELEDAFIEVCAPVYHIHGYCTEYDVVGSVVQAHHNLKCNDVTPPCASSYLSTEAYLYKGCNDVVKKKLCGSSETSALSCPVTQYSSTDIYWLVSSTRSPTGNLTDSEIRYNTKDWKPYNGAATITTTVTTITTALIFNALIFIGGILMFDVYKKWRTKQRYKECPLGYRDINCSKVCDFPYFGKDCQSKCNCSNILCDHKWGCSRYIDIIESLPQTSFGTSVYIINTTTKLVETKFPKNSPILQALQSSIFYIAVAFVAFFGLFSSTYFYKHCIKKTSVINGKADEPLSDRQELYNMLHQHVHIRREINNESAYLEPVSSVHYEEIDTYAEPDEQ